MSIEFVNKLKDFLKEGAAFYIWYANLQSKNFLEAAARSNLEIRQYLNGQTVSVSDGKGWTLVCVDSYGLGFGKISGGVLKNHYPKGLRSLHL